MCTRNLFATSVTLWPAVIGLCANTFSTHPSQSINISGCRTQEQHFLYQKPYQHSNDLFIFIEDKILFHQTDKKKRPNEKYNEQEKTPKDLGYVDFGN